MPPHVPRKRLRTSSPEKKTKVKASSGRATRNTTANRRKATLYDDLDATASPHSEQASTGLKALNGDDSDSSLTSLSEQEFEDVPAPKRQKTEQLSVDDDDDDEDIEFEDVAAPSIPIADAPLPTGDLELTLNRDTRISLTNQSGDKKGPTKIERKDVGRRGSMEAKQWIGRQTRTTKAQKQRERGKGKERESRDWGPAAQRLEEGAPDMSHGDPLFRLMQSLVAWWKQRFRATAPGLRKWGYMSLERLDRLTKAHKEQQDEQEQFGEAIRGLDDFRQCALSCRGSRDVGAQLFTALLRGLGLDARMVASLQPLGFGWNKLEDAEAEEEDDGNGKSPAPNKRDRQAENTSSSKSARSTRTAMQAKVEVIEDSDDLDLEFKDTDDESVVEMKITPKKTSIPTKQYDKDLDYPHYWTEVLSPVTNKYLPIDSIVKGTIGTNRDLVETFEPRGAKADKARQVVCYVVGYSRDGTAKDVTVRYLKRQVLPGRTKGARMPLEKVPVYNRHGKVKRYESFDWFKTALSGYRRGGKKHPLTEADQQEDATELKAAKPEKKEVKEGEETLQYYKQSKDFVLKQHLKREEALLPDGEPVKVFKNKGKGSKVEEEDVYLRSDVVLVKSAETWHKQGRAPIAGEMPLKRVPYRAATLNRKREILEAEAATGEKVLQGLYSHEQTDWIIPPPIKDGIIPKNEYGNIDLFRLQVDYAEAVVDFEFGHRMAVPVIQGAVIAEEHYDRVMTELEKDEAERVRKESEKRRKAALGMWRKFLMGMRIVKRIREEYGEIDESVSVFGHNRRHNQPRAVPDAQDEDMAGGFLPEGYEEDVEADGSVQQQTSSFFPALEEDDQGGGDDDLVMEHDDAEPGAENSKLPERAARRGKSSRTTKQKTDVSEDEEDEGGVGWADPDDDYNE
ncbi:DNA repair protein rhp42 [Cladobotryum mycophilum]|uniref:DNA repair protein rhp42 n=1 Tax=Cladobotryum mycophilum TaxID=491253 RepID=A0ABR0S8M3_9HYPO